MVKGASKLYFPQNYRTHPSRLEMPVVIVIVLSDLMDEHTQSYVFCAFE